MVDRKAGHYCSVAVQGLSGHILESRIFGQKSIIQNKDFKILVKIAGCFTSLPSKSVVKLKSNQICMPLLEEQRNKLQFATQLVTKLHNADSCHDNLIRGTE